MADLIEIKGGGLSAAINPFGAELTHLRDRQGRELMTDADPKFWTGHAPLLFPIVGRLNGDVLRLDGAEYPMKQHGFARRSAFTLFDHGVAHARFRLEDDAETRAAYPFAFAFDAAYSIDADTLTLAITIANRGDVSMPASFGFHPGFAWPLPYGAARAHFRLVDDAETRAVYPFAFALDATYSIAGATLTVAIAITNRGDVAMPASFGFHPAFAWPLPYGAPREDHRIVFAADEPGTLVELNDGLATSADRASPLDGRVLHLKEGLFDDDALIWNGLASRSVRYGASTGPQLEVAFDADKLGIWSKPGPARFVCIEPWHGVADPAGYTGDFRAKPGVFEIAPGGTWSCQLRVTLTA